MSVWSEVAWRPVIGDPSIMGWVTVFLYAVAAAYCVRIGFLRGADFKKQVKRQLVLWRVLALVVSFLCVNKQLDLQTLLTEMARYYSRQYDLYEMRRQFQVMFIAGLLLFGIFALTLLFVMYRAVLRDNLLVIMGATFLMVYVLVRAASFHHVDRLIGSSVLGIKLNWVFEIFGLILIIINAKKHLGNRRS